MPASQENNLINSVTRGAIRAPRFLFLLNSKSPNKQENADMKKYLSLDKSFMLRHSASESVLHSLRTGATYILFDDQIELIYLLNGAKTLQQIIYLYSKSSRNKVVELLAKLKQVGALSFTDKPQPRTFITDKVPDHRLEAVHLEASAECNMRCVHCYQGDLIASGLKLNLTEIISLLDQMQRMQVNNIGISGGEPLMMKNLDVVLRASEERNIRISALFTNGLLINEKFVQTVRSLLSKFPVFVSLDSIPGNTFAFRGFSGGESHRILSKIIDNLRTLVQFGIPVTVNTVINLENIEHLGKMYDLMIECGVKSWRLGFPKPTTLFQLRGASFNPGWQMIAERCLPLLGRHLANGSPFSLQIEYLFREVLFKQGLQILSDQDYVCDYEGRRRECCVKPNGDVVSCAYCTEIPVGNIRKTSLWDVWYSKAMQEIKTIRIGDVEGCRGCDLRSLCGTGCRANAYFLHGNFRHAKDDYACEAVRFFKEKVIPLLKIHGVV
ncbi:hypothetical protein A2456_02465 [Candidatus Nomurabacteria bacterium RIFOXYC2_FULL_36_19]|uniref:Radical SAM core domain-containing protein n=1 Tax=Candidatus Nomurabacteria bacterium RIFOXYC2_FULL_36_19 TaxID=1801806 RepID=A0A1F6YW36_9BACT|nr:MAG: hypothetical protein A2238_02730 [Candidatus Nomurabacteria bacterium RIFOXYA2_FULL_35_9]OGJ10568.1 MAG: hypothetical protein A2456_02465 [Candidatus Nomurabacteria bacterium RIFOXYC2_FULL_36_19]